MRLCRKLIAPSLALLAVCLAARADTLRFTNGDEITGTFVRASAGGCIFQSALAGRLTVPWNNIRELWTDKAYVVVGNDGHIRLGQLMITGAMIEIVYGNQRSPEFIAASAIRMVVDPKTYTEAVQAHPAPWQSWRGLVTGGFSAVSATQTASSFSGGVDLQRPMPHLGWLPQRSNTLFHFQGSYGKLSQPSEPTVRTSIYTASLEQDQDVNKRLFGFGSTELNHNIAQGLELQQAYGGGIGWKLIASAPVQLDLRADIHWTHQRFLSAVNDSFLASSFTESLREAVGRKLVWTESISLTPSYTNGLAYQMSGISAWAVPIYGSLSLNFTASDSYLNNPQPGFLRNSLQYTTGIQIALH